MKDPTTRIKELEYRCEVLEQALETITTESQRVGVKLPELKRTIAVTVVETREKIEKRH